MKWLLLFVIRTYQTLTLKRFRRKCLFKESCSNYIFRITKQKGFREGMKAFNYRINNCRPGYFIIEKGGRKLLITNKKQVIEEQFISEKIIEKKD
jgi:putative component of membrane protein insertase Oxa1/YidC/SpoIIIJ protein YidD